MNDKTKTAIIATILASLGGTFYVGQEIGKPECDYVIVHEQEEFCISKEIKGGIGSVTKDK